MTDIENLSSLDIEDTLKEIYFEFLRLEREMKSITESKKELKIYAKKKGIDIKALEECLKKIKQPREELENIESKVQQYLNILQS